MWMNGLPVSIYVLHIVPGTLGQKRAPDLLELEKIPHGHRCSEIKLRIFDMAPLVKVQLVKALTAGPNEHTVDEEN